MDGGVPENPIYDLLFRRHVGAIHFRRLVLPETINGQDEDLLTCADMFWGDEWWHDQADRRLAA